MAHVIRDRKKLLARVRRIGGQVAALEKALQDGADCADLLVQIAAAKGAMHGLMMEVLAGHLAEHVVAEDDAAGRAREAEVVLALMRSLGR
jgi:DNA-binding FrmR family transcriptional regulator